MTLLERFSSEVEGLSGSRAWMLLFWFSDSEGAFFKWLKTVEVKAGWPFLGAEEMGEEGEGEMGGVAPKMLEI